MQEFNRVVLEKQGEFLNIVKSLQKEAREKDSKIQELSNRIKRLEFLKNKEGWIYLIKSNDWYKVGRTAVPEERFLKYRTENPFVEILFNVKVKNYIRIEEIILEKYAHKKEKGEWFTFNEKDIEDIKRLVESNKIQEMATLREKETETIQEKKLRKPPKTKLSDEELIEKAVGVIKRDNRASASLLQRRLKLGYTRAARIIDKMEERGLVGAFNNHSPREIKNE